jgi:hypothetical protein
VVQRIENWDNWFKFLSTKKTYYNDVIMYCAIESHGGVVGIATGCGLEDEGSELESR